MATLCIDKKACTGCGLCVGTCPAGALKMAGGAPVVNPDACVLCGLCVKACPAGAIRVEKEAPAQKVTQSTRDVWVFAEMVGGVLQPVAFELLGRAQVLAAARGGKVAALVMGSAATQQAQELTEAGADRVYACVDDVFDTGMTEPFATVLAQLIETERPETLLFGATVFGRSLAPRVAARVGTGLTADCTGLEIGEDGLLLQTRPAFGGNLMATIMTAARRPQMATVRPGVFCAAARAAGRQGEVVRLPAPTGLVLPQVLETLPGEQGESIASARVIVSAGRGIGSQKNLALVRKLAEKLGGSMGVSRPLVDMGWAPYPCQIGQTGLAVAPDLLVCCGISGAIQHLAGIGGAKVVVAINSDPQAPIFGAAHYRVVGDTVEVLKQLLAQSES